MKQKLAERQCWPDDMAVYDKAERTSEAESFQILASSGSQECAADPNPDPNMEVDFLQAEKRTLMTKVSLLEQQVRTLFWVFTFHNFDFLPIHQFDLLNSTSVFNHPVAHPIEF